MRLIYALTASMGLLLATGAGAVTLLTNANGYTINADGKLQQFEAMAVTTQGKILAIGTLAQVKQALPTGGATKHLDLLGKTVLPGLIDAHGHVLNLGLGANALQVRAAQNLKQAQEMIAAYGKQHPDHAWITGFGWNQVVWQLGRFPLANEIDQVLPDRPVILSRVDGHASWANTLALRLAGIDRNTPDPEGGKIERDASGNPTGVLIDKASNLVWRLVPPTSTAQKRAALDASMQQLAAVGLTSVHDAGVDVAMDGLYREYAANGKLTTRVYGMIRGVEQDFDTLAARGPLNGMADERYALRAVKLFSDGALGSRGAALLAPYHDAAHSKGLLFMDAATMQKQVNKAASKGYQVNVHAIGDAGNAQVLNALATATKPAGQHASDSRHRVEHAQVVALSDIPRFARHGIIASMQPVHATSDKNMAEARVGPERIRGAYAWRSLLQQGARLACGSDFPIEAPNPFEGIHAAVTRQDMSGAPVGGWYPEQGLSVLEALRCFTLDAAYAAHQEHTLGSLVVGKWADFIVIDQDLFKISIYDIHKIKVLQTWVGGKSVYQSK